MPKNTLGLAVVVFAVVFAAVPSIEAQQHRATRLGNPATRFANPLKKPEDLRNLLRSEGLRADVDFIARESGFRGNLEDFRRAAATNQIFPLRISVGTRLPAMSSRKNGRPVLLRDVLWAGNESIDAYEFHFDSQGRRYRVVSPKACANFWLEDHGKVVLRGLALECEAPDEVAVGRPVRVCLILKNTGDETEPLATLTLPIPDGATFANATNGAQEREGRLVWQCPNLAAGDSRQVCAVFYATKPGPLSLASTVLGRRSPPVQKLCQTRVIGIPAVLLQVMDINDPVEVGAEETYEISVFNQGTAALTSIGLACTLADQQQFVSGAGATAVRLQGQTITVEKLSILKPKETAVWRITVKALTPGDVRFTTDLTCDQFQTAIRENEATQQY